MPDYNPHSLKADEFINHEEILGTLKFADEHKKDFPLIDDILEKALEMLISVDGMNGADGMLAATYAVALLILDVAEGNEYDGLLEEFTTCLKKVLNEIWKRRRKDNR